LIERMDGGGEDKIALRAAAKPSAARDLLDRQRLTTTCGFQAHDVPREISQQVAAWDPCRQREVLISGGVFDATFDLEMVTIKIGQTDSILDQCSFLRAARDTQALSHTVACKKRDALLR
jgi:hypothetical protein